MRHAPWSTVGAVLLALGGAGVQGQDKEGKPGRAEALPAAPGGFDRKRDGIDRGKLETIEYDSKSVGIKRKAQVYTPPGYSKDRKYPVLYLLHGIGGDEREWTRGGAAHVVLDNLIADRKAVPMVVVLPSSEPPAEQKIAALLAHIADKGPLDRTDGERLIDLRAR